jgi:4-hydroxy-4-methyl-2-oxoglutarate aldolase
MPGTSADPLTALLDLDSCAVSDALDSMQLPPAVVGLVPLTVRRRIAGRVNTVKLGGQKPLGGPPRHLATAAIAAAREGDIIVVEHASGIECAGWGGVLSVGAQLKGVRGIVIDGPARDIDEAIELEFPVFGRLPTARTARGRVYEQDYDCPVTIGGVSVVPGDFVLADSSGVAFIPARHLEEILRRASRIMDRERRMIQALRAGDDISEVVGRDYESMLEDID